MKQKEYEETKQRLEEYSQKWADMMVQIWKDRLTKFKIDYGRTLSQEVKGGRTDFNDVELSLQFRYTYLKYGIYFALGVGNGYKKKNKGKLDILDPAYRQQHKLDIPRLRSSKAEGLKTSGEPRKKHNWKDLSWFISRKVLGNEMVDIIGDKYVGMFDEIAGPENK